MAAGILGPSTGSGGSFSGSGLAANASDVVWGPKKQADFHSQYIVIAASGNQTFRLVHEYTTDDGATWYVRNETPSSIVNAVTGIAAGYVNSAVIFAYLGFNERIRITAVGGTLAYTGQSRVIHTGSG